MTTGGLSDSTPIRVHRRDGRLHVEWCRLNGRRFVEPFFQDTIDACLSLPNNAPPRAETPIEILGEFYEQQPGLMPAGFIFHMSRCGSTLVSQLLAALPQNIVLSEAEPLDAIMRARGQSREQQVAWLRWMVSALGQRRASEEHLFLKMDSWHILQLPLIREAFPDVPWVFLYRDPVEVMVSHRRHPGRQMMPGGGIQLPGVDAIEACLMVPDEYCARVLGAICQAALDAYEPKRCLLLNYRQLPAASWELLPQHFGMDYRAEEINTMRLASVFDAKRPVRQFQNDSEGKQREVTEEQRRLADRWVDPLYERLEALRFGFL